MIRYIIEKTICNDYAHGFITLTEKDGQPKVFCSKELAIEYLESLKISSKEIAELYNIKPYVI